MMKFLIIMAQYHSLSGEPVHKIPAFSWENPGWSEGRTDFNVSHHVSPSTSTPSFNPSYSTGASSGTGGSVPPSHLNNDFGNMD